MDNFLAMQVSITTVALRSHDNRHSGRPFLDKILIFSLRKKEMLESLSRQSFKWYYIFNRKVSLKRTFVDRM